jgi:glycerophosphoryl diester phosphodiesterase
VTAWKAKFGFPLILGHRGASARVTENTLEAFVKAKEEGADGVELDVQCCGSGEVVVFHDRDLKRLLKDDRSLLSVKLSELRKLKLAGGETVPTLDDVLDALPAGFLVNVELKGQGTGRGLGLVEGVCRVLDRHPKKSVLCSSFDPGLLALLRIRRPAVLRGLLFHQEQSLPLRRGWLAPLLGAFALHPERVLVTEERMSDWRRGGFTVNVWTVDDPVEARRLADLGVDAIITNDPEGLRRGLGG